MKITIFSKAFWEKCEVELYIGNLLRVGVLLACVLTVFGGIVYLFQNTGQILDYRPTPEGQEFKGAPHYLRNISGIWNGLLCFDGAAIIQLGVLVLIATPMSRVIFSLFAFLIERDFLYVFITLIVLVVIIANMILGLH